MTVAGQTVVNYFYDNDSSLTQIAQGSATVSFGTRATGGARRVRTRRLGVLVS